MRRIRRGVIGLLLCAALLPLPVLSEASGSAPSVSAGGAILIEASSGRVLYEKNADGQFEPASTTKIMTAILAIESGDLDRIVTVSKRAAGTEGSSLYLKEGETLPLRELIYGLMMQSGNDAAIAIAEAVAGSAEAFVERMNEKARSLGLVKTQFQNPNGLHAEGHHTTARELCAIAAYAMQNATFRTVVSTQYRVAQNCSNAHTFRNKNKYLTQYEGCNGIKTGYTKAAGKCLVFSAERNGMQLIGVVLNAPNMWEDAKTLLDFGFETFELCRIADADEIFTVPVENAEKSTLPAAAKQDILYPIRSDGTETLHVKRQICDSVCSPVEAGTALGSITATLNGTQIASVPIVALEGTHRMTFGAYWRKAIERW